MISVASGSLAGSREDPAAPLNPLLHVVAGVIRDERGRVLLAQRPSGKPHAGFWEFPGGKIESGESPEAALFRELHEELGIHARVGRRLIAVPHQDIVLEAYRVIDFAGTVCPQEGQKLAWIAVEDIDTALLPPADRPIVSALRLPVIPSPAEPVVPNGSAKSGEAWAILSDVYTMCALHLRRPSQSHKAFIADLHRMLTQITTDHQTE